MSLEFNNYNPYMLYDEKENIIINKWGDIIKIAKLALPRYGNTSENYFFEIQEKLESYLSSLPFGYTYQRLDFVFPKKNELSKEGRDNFEVLFLEHYNKQYALKSESYLILSYSPKKRNVSFGLPFLKIGESIPELSPSIIQKFQSDFDNLIALFPDSQIPSKSDLNDLIFNRYFNLNFFHDKPTGEKDFTDEMEHLQIGDHLVKALSMLPDGLPPITTDCIYNYEQSNEVSKEILPKSFMIDKAYTTTYIPKVINHAIRIEDKKQIEKELKDRVNKQSWFDPNTHETKELISNGEKLILSHWGMLLIGDPLDKKTFKSEIDNVRQSLRESGIGFSENTRNTLRTFYSYSFGNTGLIPKLDWSVLPMKASLTFSAYESFRGHDHFGGVLFKDRFSQSPIAIDFFNNKNALNKNICCLGESGSGKSVTINYLLDSLYKNGDDVVVVDLGYSYEFLCQKNKGLFLECSEEKPIKLNPFGSLENINGQWQLSAQEDIDFLVILFYICWKGDDKNSYLNNDIRAVLELVIKNYIKHCNKHKEHPSFNQFYLFVSKELSSDDFKHIDKDHFDKVSFLLVMKKFLREDTANGLENGRYYYLFDDDMETMKQININKFIVFELEQIRNDATLLPLTYFIIMRLVFKKLIKEKQNRKNLIFALDECWMLLGGSSDIQEFLVYCFRTFRKHNGSVMISTQNVDDLLNSDVGEKIYNNCSIQLLKKQRIELRSRLKDTFQFSSYQLAQLYSIENKKEELFVKIGESCSVVNISLDPHNLLLYQSDNEIKLALKNQLKKTDNIVTAVKDYLNDKVASQ